MGCLRNIWYMAAWETEVTQSHGLTRTILEQPVLLVREALSLEHRRWRGTRASAHGISDRRRIRIQGINNRPPLPAPVFQRRPCGLWHVRQPVSADHEFAGDLAVRLLT